MQAQAVDLTWLVKPGAVSGSLLTGMLGLQPSPTVGEAAAYLIYAVPMGLYVIWPDRWQLRRRRAPAGTVSAPASAAASGGPGPA
jgi:high-affinity iron transporter